MGGNLVSPTQNLMKQAIEIIPCYIHFSSESHSTHLPVRGPEKVLQLIMKTIFTFLNGAFQVFYFIFLNFQTQVQFSSVTQSSPTLCNPMNRRTPGFPVHHQLPEFTQTHVHRVNDAIQPSHPLSSPSPPAPNPSQHQSLFQ